MVPTTSPSPKADESPPGDPRLEVADALTAILLHAEALGHSGRIDRLAASRRIAENAKRVWRALGEWERDRLQALSEEPFTAADAKA